MSFFDVIDFKTAELPGWLNNIVALARPIAVTMTVAIPPLGAFTVGTVAFFRHEQAMFMVEASVKFLQGIPDAAYGAITAIALAYTAGKSAEVIKAPAQPGGRPSPEGEPTVPPVASPPDLTKLEIPNPAFGAGSASSQPTEILE